MNAITSHHAAQQAGGMPAYLHLAMATIRDMVASGERVNGAALGRHLNCAQVTASRYLRVLVDMDLVVRGGNTKNAYFLPADMAPEIKEADVPPRARDYLTSVWTPERKDALRTLATTGASLDAMASALGLQPDRGADQVKAQMKRQCLLGTWKKARPAPAEPVRADAEVGTRVSLASLIAWLDRAGHQVTAHAKGFTLNGAFLATRGELLAQANLLRSRRGFSVVVLE